MLSFQSSKITPLLESENILSEALNNVKLSFDYPNPSGDEELRKKIKVLHPHWDGEVLITNSATEATYLALSPFKGKRLALNVPSYFGVIRQAKELNITVCEWETVKDLEKLKDIDVILLTSNFTPPTGQSFSEEDKNKIANYANKMDSTVIEDNAYEFLSYNKNMLTSIKAKKAIRINSFSKILTPSLRMGFIITEKEIFAKLRSHKITMNLSSSGLSQSIISNVLSHEDFIYKWQNELHERALIAKKAIKKHLDQEVHIHDGGAFLKLDLPEKFDVNEFILKAKSNSVLIDDNRNQYINGLTQNYIRLHLGAIKKEDINKAIKTLKKIMK